MGAMQCYSGKNPGNHVNQRKLHMVHTLRFGKSTKVAHGRTRVKNSREINNPTLRPSMVHHKIVEAYL